MSSFDPYTSLLLSDTSLSHSELDPCSFLQEDVLGAVTSPSTPGTPDGVVNSSSASSTSMGSATSESMVMASPSKVLASPWTVKPARVSNPLMSPSAEDFFLAESLKGSSAVAAAAAAASALPSLALAQSASSAFPHLVLDSSAGGLPAFAASLNSGVVSGGNNGGSSSASAASSASASSTNSASNSGSGSGLARSAAGMLSSHSAMNEESDDEDDEVPRRPKGRGVKRERSADDSDSDSDNSDSHADDGSQPSFMRPSSCSPSPDGPILMGAFGGSGSGEVDAKKLKLAHKAELARRNRRRKKMRMADLEREVNMLKEELERERKRRKVAEESLASASARPAAAALATPVAAAAAAAPAPAAPTPVQTSTVAIEQSLVEESRAVHDAMVEATRNPSATPERTAALIQNLVEIFRKKNQVTSEHLNAIKNFLSPAVPLRFLQWIMSQQDRFYQDENGLWSSLFKHEVGLSAEQMHKVLSMRETVRSQTNSAADVARAYERLSQTLDGHLSTSAANMEQFMTVLTPEQLARFFVWVNRFGSVCVQIHV